MYRWILLLFALLALPACWQKRVKHLSGSEFDHYYALRPFMDEDQRKTYLKSKTREERDAYLKSQGLWDMFYQHSEPVRDAIVAGEVQTGWSRDMVYMAWGKPYDKRKLVGRPATRSEMLVYRFEVQEDGSIMVWVPESKTSYHAVRRFEQHVILDDNHVTEILQEDGWN